MIDKENLSALTYPITGLIISIIASLKPPTSLNQAKNVPLVLTCVIFVVERLKPI